MSTHKVMGTKSYIEIPRLKNVTSFFKGTKTLSLGVLLAHQNIQIVSVSLMPLWKTRGYKPGRQIPIGKAVRAEELEFPWGCVRIECEIERGDQGTKIVRSGRCGWKRFCWC